MCKWKWDRGNRKSRAFALDTTPPETTSSRSNLPRGVGPIIALAACLFSVPAAWAQPTPPPFACSPDGVLFQYPGNVAPTEVRNIDMATGGSSISLSLSGRRINAIGYNVLDDRIYGWDIENASLVQIGSDGTVVDLAVTGGVPGIGRLTGDVDENGHYWLTGGGGSGDWAQIDLTTPTPQLLDSGPIQGGGISTFTGGVDWAYVPGGGDYLYRIMARDGESWLFRFNRSSGQHENLGSLGTLDSNSFGAVYADPDGFLYISNNQSGNIYRVDIHNVTATLFSAGPISGFNDGARCFRAPLPLDFGDAPDSYDTLLASGAARHSAPDYSAVNNAAPLMLGETVDIEFDGQPSPDADGDDSSATDDDDAVADPIAMVAGQPVSVDVFVTNITGQPATLAGWIDLDASGTFDTGERAAPVTVPAGAATEFTLNFPAGTAVENTYARFRVYPGNIADPEPAGPAEAGEVEDYPVATGHVHIEKSVDPADVTTLSTGDTFTYTVAVSNIGAVLLSDLEFVDDLSGVIDDATYNNDAAVDSGPGTVVFNTSDQIAWEGDLAVGEVSTVTYSVTIDSPPGGDATIVNAVASDAPGSNCPPPGPPTDPDCFTVVPQPQLETVKTSDAIGNVQPGDVVNYNITVTNTGPAATDNAAIADLLAGALDDATYNGDANAGSGTVSFDSATERLVWAGSLAAAGSVTITYSVTANDAGALGDGVLNNALSAPDCPSPPVFDPGEAGYDATCVVSTPVEAWTVVKTTNPAGTVAPGMEVAYTLALENTGGADLVGLTFSDDLGNVLDDAGYNNNQSASTGSATYLAPEVTWTGDLAVDETATVTYSVTVNAAASLGDQALVNAVTGSSNCPDPAITSPGDPDFNPACVTSNLVETWQAVKTSDAGTTVEPGDTINYEVTITNTGATDLINVGLTVLDDLTAVLDDATYQNDAAATIGSVTYSEPDLFWEGNLPAAQSAIVSYSVEVNTPASGDGALTNTLVGSPNCPDPPVLDPDAPDFNPDCVLVTPTAPAVTIEKTLVGESGAISGRAEPGETLTYAVLLSNTGGSDADDYAVTDRLDANLVFVSADNGGAHDGAGTGGEIDWTGLEVPADGSLTLTVAAAVVNPVPEGTTHIGNVAYETGTGMPDCGVTPEPPNCVRVPLELPPDPNEPGSPGDPGEPPPAQVPFNATWMLILLASLLSALGALALRGRAVR